MEKDNKKLRDDARKEYNDTIRVSFSLTHFISAMLICSLS